MRYLSQQFTLLPGAAILTGTPEGVGFARTPLVCLRDGDCIEFGIDGIGALRNAVKHDTGPLPDGSAGRPSAAQSES